LSARRSQFERKKCSGKLIFPSHTHAWRAVLSLEEPQAKAPSKLVEEEKGIMIATKVKVNNSRMAIKDVVVEDLTDSLTEEYDNDDDEDDDDDCERGLSRQPSFDTASLTLKSSSSTETITIEEEAFGSPTHLRRRQQKFPAPPHENEPSHDDGVDEDEDDKKQFHETHKHASKRRHSLIRSLLMSALVVSSYYFLWSSKTLDRMDLSAKNRWKMPSRQQTRKLVHKIQRQPLRDGVTVRLKGDRIDLLWQSLDRLARCPSVETVQIEWGHQNKQAVPEILLYHKSRKVTPVGTTHTDAVLLLGESVKLSCEDLERAYHEWMLDPVLLVGFLPLWDKDEGSYALLSDHALFTHKIYLDSIDKTSSLQSESHCQHLAFSAYVTALSSKSPVAIISNLGRAAPSKYKSGSKERECVEQLNEATGLQSLPESRTTYYVGRQYSFV
jgi:hypothetical protein